jgi:hypothetical protein
MLEATEIKAVNYFAVVGIQEKGFIRIVASDEQTLLATAHRDRQACRIGNIPEFRTANVSP